MTTDSPAGPQRHDGEAPGQREEHRAPLEAAPPGELGLAAWTVPELLLKMLGRIRRQLGMELAFISEFTEGRRVFRCVDAGASEIPIRAGDSDPLDDSFCLRVADGRLPELMVDACRNAEALSLPVTQALPVGAHLSVPIRVSGGRVLGTICCFSRQPQESLSEHDLETMRLMAAAMADYFEHGLRLDERPTPR